MKTSHIILSCLLIILVGSSSVASALDVRFFQNDAENDKTVNHDNLAAKVNSMNIGWEAEENHFSAWTVGDVKNKLLTTSLIHDERFLLSTPFMTAASPYEAPRSTRDLPENFDGVKEWGKCAHPIRNQGHCGSCWAFSASEVLSDRFCIASNGSIDVVLSPQDFVSCDWYQFGCSGGMIPVAWFYLKHSGIVSDSCMPYVSGDGTKLKCPANCKDDSTKLVKQSKYYAKTYHRIPANNLEQELVEHGPIQTGFLVYREFLSYKSGVYRHVEGTGEALGGHAVKIVGYGVDSKTGLPYWQVANSWSEKWGENGYFKILRGSNECQFESLAYAGIPDLQNLPQ